MDVRLTCIVCGRKFYRGQGVILTFGDAEYVFHSKACAIKFIRRFLEELDPSDAKAAAERAVRRFEDERKAKEVLALLGVGQYIDRYPIELSGGEQQRVAIARALANDPKLILADEPTGNLDTVTAERIMELLMELNNSGKTVIVVTHNPDHAKYAHMVVRIKDGKIVSVEEGGRPSPYKPEALLSKR